MAEPYESPIKQIRDGTLTVKTPSLLGAGNEPVPDEIVRDLLIEQWVETEATPRPVVTIKTGDELQVDLKRGDVVVVSVQDWSSEFTGHRHEHINIEVPVSIELHTVKSRQRLWNLMAEVRRIIFAWILALRPYQSLYFDGFRPDYNAAANYFSGVVSVRLTADILPVFRPVVDGMESPNTTPNAPTGEETH